MPSGAIDPHGVWVFSPILWMCPRGSGYALTLRAPRKRVLFTVSRFLGFFWGEGVWRFLFQKVFIYKINFFNRYKVMQIISLSLTCFEFLLLKNGSVYSKGVEFMCEELFLSAVVPYFPFNVSGVCSDIFSFISFFFNKKNFFNITKWISYTYTYIPTISPPSCVSLPSSLSHPSRRSQSTELISLCYAAASLSCSIFTYILRRDPSFVHSEENSEVPHSRKWNFILITKLSSLTGEGRSFQEEMSIPRVTKKKDSEKFLLLRNLFWKWKWLQKMALDWAGGHSILVSGLPLYLCSLGHSHDGP